MGERSGAVSTGQDGPGIGTVLAGIIPGFGQGYQQAREAKKKDAFIAAQTDLIKQEAKFKEKMLVMEAMKSDLFGTMTPEEQKLALFPKTQTPAGNLKEILALLGGGGTTEVPLPEYQPGQGMPPFRQGATMTLPAQIAGMNGGLNALGLTREDLIRGVIKKEAGAEMPMYHRTATVAGPGGMPYVAPMNNMGLIDMSKAVPAPIKPEMQSGVGGEMAPVQTPVNPYTREPMGAPIQTGPPPTMDVETPTPGGGKTKQVLPKFPSLGSSGTGTKVTGTTGGVRTELDLLDVPIPSSDLMKWSDGNGNAPPMGWTPRQAQGRGFKQTPEGMASESAGKVVMVAQAIKDIEVAEGLLFPKPGVFNTKLAVSARGLPVVGTAPEWIVKGSQTVMSSLQNAVNAKLRVETGAQANPSEVENIMARFFPTWRDDYSSAKDKLSRLKAFMTDGKFIMDPKGKLVIVEPPKGKTKPSLDLGKKKEKGEPTRLRYNPKTGELE